MKKDIKRCSFLTYHALRQNYNQKRLINHCAKNSLSMRNFCYFRSLRQLLDKEMMESASLRLQVDDLKRDLSSSTETHHATVHALTRF